MALRDSQEKGTGQAQPFLVLAERAIEDSPSFDAHNKRRFGPALEDERREKKRTKTELTITVLDNH